MKVFMKFLLPICFTLFSSVAFAGITQSQKIGQVLYNAEIDYSYFIGEAKWKEENGCSGATYVRIKSNLPGKKEILSIALSAHMASKNVRFRGNCDSDPDYYDAFYIIVN